MTYAPAMTSSPSAAPWGAPPAGSALTGGWARLARAGVLGGASLALAASGHVIGGGVLPGGGLLALLGIALALVAVSLTARRLRFGALVAMLAIEQIALHLVFHAATAAVSCAVVAMPGHAMEPATICASGTVSVAGWPMLLGHALALVATAWLLARGERWLWRVVDRVHAYATAHPTRVRRPRPVDHRPQLAPVVLLRWAPAGPRGPPHGLF